MTAMTVLETIGSGLFLIGFAAVFIPVIIPIAIVVLCLRIIFTILGLIIEVAGEVLEFMFELIIQLPVVTGFVLLGIGAIFASAYQAIVGVFKGKSGGEDNLERIEKGESDFKTVDATAESETSLNVVRRVCATVARGFRAVAGHVHDMFRTKSVGTIPLNAGNEKLGESNEVIVPKGEV